MKMFKNLGIITLAAFISFSISSCFASFLGGSSWESEYPDDGIPEEERPVITLTFDLNGGSISTPLINGTLTGKYGGRIRLASPTKEGYIFTGWVPALPSRFPAENTTYTATFNRTREYSINYNLGGGTNNRSNPTSYNIKSPTITFQPPTRQGYTFEAWYTDQYYRTRITQIPSGSTGNVSIYPKWVPGMSAYRIEHWLQNANDNEYTISPNDTETRAALSESTATASPKRYNGFTVFNVEQKKVAGDGSTVVKVLYNRNIVEFYFNLDGGNGASVLRGKYGETVVAPSAPVKPGYEFTGWIPALPPTFVANSTYRATWKVSANPTYKVEHWQQNPNDNNYSLFTTETKTGSTNTSTAIRNYTGFTVQSIDQSKNPNDGSTVIKIYYSRNIVELVFDLNGGTGANSLRGKYGANIGAVQTPTRTGYTFAGWSPTLPATFPATNAIYKANWTTAAPQTYKVEHWQQNPNDNGYSLYATTVESKIGSGGNTSTAIKTYPGFTIQSIDQSADNGNAVVKIYYNRNIIELMLNLDGGSGATSLKGRFGARVTPPANPTKNGYTFVGWSPALPATFPEYNAAYRALWNANAPVVTTTTYKVEHWQQNPDDYNYTLVQTETKSGTANSTTNASARDFTGFWPQGFSQTTINANGSTVVKIYYNRNAADLNLDLDGGTGITLIKGVFGATVVPPPNPTKNGYTFAGWYPPLPAKFPAASQVHKAIWK